MGNPEIAVATPNHGDEKPSEQVSLEALFDALETPLLVYAEKFTNDSDLAQDVVQEAFMKLHIQFDAVRQPRPWLYRTVHNLALNHRRAGQKIVSLEGTDSDENGVEGADISPLPSEQAERAEAINQTRCCLDSLDEKGRTLIRLKFEEELSYKEISARTGLSVTNVGYILHHTLKTLAAELVKTGVQL